MEAVFPITQRNGEPYHTLSDFTKMFDQVKSGRYLLGQGYGWHSGVHLTSKMVPWGKGLRPIQSMLDGKIIAYRIHEDYQKTLYKGQELKFSNNFVLIEHECQNPDDSNDNFKFYSLYMHLAPPADIGANSSPSTRYKMVMEQGKRNVRIFKLDSKPKKESWEDTVGMSAGTILEYLYAEEKETHKYNINGTDYHMIKCRVVEAGDQNATREKGMEGKLVWFAAGKASEFDILENTSVMQPVPVSEPPWMKKDAAKLRNGSVVPLTLSVDGTPDLGISINAGDEIGYMGLHEYSNDINATKKEDNRVHIELFSVDEPPEYFKTLISPPNAEETPLIVIDGSDSDGALSSENTFFVSLAKEVSKSRKSSDEAAEAEEVDFSSATAKELKTYLNNKRKHFERVIVKHPSDWHVEKSDSIYERIHTVAREIYEGLLSRGFVSLEDFENSPWREKVLAEYDVFSEHERERAKEFSWLEEVNFIVDRDMQVATWHFWPFSITRKKSWADTSFGMLVGKVESNNDYTAYNRTFPNLKAFYNTNIDEMPISEIIDKQANRECFAVGRFQLIPTTLKDAVRYLKIDISSRFSKQIQNKIFDEYLITVKRPNIIAFLEGKGSVEDAMYDWAKEFASAGVERGRKISRGRTAIGGESYYSGDGLNKAHLSIKDMRSALIKSKLEMK